MFALFLVSDDAPSNAIIGAGAGVYQSAFVTMNEGVLLPEAERTIEGFAAAWGKISDRSGDTVVQNGMEQSMHAMAMLQKAAGGEWTFPLNVSGGSAYSSVPSLGLTPNGDVLLTWVDSLDGSGYAYYAWVVDGAVSEKLAVGGN